MQLSTNDTSISYIFQVCLVAFMRNIDQPKFHESLSLFDSLAVRISFSRYPESASAIYASRPTSPPYLPQENELNADSNMQRYAAAQDPNLSSRYDYLLLNYMTGGEWQSIPRGFAGRLAGHTTCRHVMVATEAAANYCMAQAQAVLIRKLLLAGDRRARAAADWPQRVRPQFPQAAPFHRLHLLPQPADPPTRRPAHHPTSPPPSAPPLAPRSSRLRPLFIFFYPCALPADVPALGPKITDKPLAELQAEMRELLALAPRAALPVCQHFAAFLSMPLRTAGQRAAAVHFLAVLTGLPPAPLPPAREVGRGGARRVRRSLRAVAAGVL
jgi:hypothetical protein